ncbi:hypothetical protein V7S43_007611 [Phytophthora oleae]|uniref:PiggyBac transposable element-derived protein domain-containing protein n=1 Tax=Phytophthora oleae TaxID=2107226 RepID=A0ABD3FNN7_9STRA
MHMCRSPEEFLAVSKLCLKRWREDSQHAYADWFAKIYLAERWSRWYATSGTPGVVPSQNPLEAHNGVLKTCGVRAKRVKTGIMLNDSIPGIFAVASRDPPKSPFTHYSEGPLPSDIVHQAKKHILAGAHYECIDQKRCTCSIFFNEIAYMASSTKITGDEFSAERVGRYLNAKQGTLLNVNAVTDINLVCLSLHEVEFLDIERGEEFTLPIKPTIAIDQMKEIRALYRCDCKMFWTTGFMLLP